MAEAPPAPLSAAERAALLAVARAAVRAALGVGPAPALPVAEVDAGQGALGRPGAAVVTLRAAGRIRGSAGTLEPAATLVGAVAAAAAAAACDPRFEPLAGAELAGLDLRVARLGPGRPLRSPADLDPARDAVAVERGWHRGLQLPGEAAAAGWDAATTLRRACLRAGLPPSAWTEPDARVRLHATEEI